MKYSIISTLSFFGLALAAPSNELLPRGDQPNLSQVTIENVVYAGSGCRPGTGGLSISPDKQAFTLSLSEMAATYEKGGKVADRRKNCNVNLDVHYPGGFQFGIFQVDYRGYANVDDGLIGQLRNQYHFTGGDGNIDSAFDFTGAWDEQYLRTDKMKQASIVWCPCGASAKININSALSLVPNPKKRPSPDATGQLTVDTVDGKFKTEYHWVWRACKP